jgi:hypothetical protein
MSNFTNFELLNLRHDLGALCDPTDPVAICAAIETVDRKLAKDGFAMRSRLQEVADGPLSYERDAAKLGAALEQMLQSSTRM